MKPNTKKEAEVAAAEALELLTADIRKHGGKPVTEETAAVLVHWFLSGAQWAFDHEFLERDRSKGIWVP